MKEYTKRFSDNIAYYKDKYCTILHRDNDLPAIIYDDGTKVWCQNGRRHRDNDLPAVIYDNGDQAWYQNGKVHREVGPAFIYTDGEKYYYLNNILYSEEDFYHKIGKFYLLTFL